MTPVQAPEGLKARYREPHRRYHDLTHIEDCLGQLNALELSAEDRRLLELAIWWHDAIYDPTRSDNEDASARLAVRQLEDAGEDVGTRDEVSRLILLTKGHEVGSDDRRGQILVSVDLSILGATPARYRAYAEAIREEYAFVPDALYRAGRAAILRRFLDAPVLFPDPAYEAALGQQARDNLSGEMAELLG